MNQNSEVDILCYWEVMVEKRYLVFGFNKEKSTTMINPYNFLHKSYYVGLAYVMSII